MVRQRDPRLARRAALSARGRAPASSKAPPADTKSTFLSLVGHELKTPLNTILGQAGLLLNDSLPDSARRAVEAIAVAGESLTMLIGDLMELARLEAGGAASEASELDIRSLSDSVRNLLLTNARARGLDFEIAVDPCVPHRLTGDASRIRQVIIKLADNALKFTERGGVTVSIALAADGNALHIAVADTGIGVDPADEARIFSAFEQGDALLTRSHGGLGLGLALAARLVNAMGGTIGLDNRPAIGATFWFTAPVAIPIDAAPADAAPLEDERIDPQLAARLRGLSVLAADDNVLHREALGRMLEASGVEADLVADGLEAAEAAGRRAYDVVLLDAHMPIAGGVQVARMIRTLVRQKAPHILIACAPGDPVEAEAVGVSDAILRKPYGARTLAAALAVALDGVRVAENEFDAGGLADLELSVGRPVLVDILRSYMSLAEDMTARIEAAVPDGDASALEQAARDLASAAGGLGLAALTAAAQELSQAAREGSISRTLSAKAAKLVALTGSTRDQLTQIYPDLGQAA